MKCAWQAYLELLPQWMRQEVDKFGKANLEELRIRIGYPPTLVLHNGRRSLSKVAVKEDISFIINIASQYSPWTADTVGQGYITANGGHRIGICGVCTVKNGRMYGISYPTSVCVRVARDFENIGQAVSHIDDSLLIIGPPGSGKTTLLRDIIRQKAELCQGNVAVVDEREEIFPLYGGKACFSTGRNTDVLSGCPKQAGIEAVLRSMNPTWIAVDEITAESDCEALLHAGWCGVQLLATAHAGSIEDLKRRPVYRSIVQYQLFNTVLVLGRDKSWSAERMMLCQ